MLANNDKETGVDITSDGSRSRAYNLQHTAEFLKFWMGSMREPQ